MVGLGFSPILLVLSLIMIAFFPTYHLYSYHLVFLQKKHLVNLLKAFGSSLFTFGIIVFPFAAPDLFQGTTLVPGMFVAAVILIVLSRFVGDHLLHLVKAVGIGFVALGVTTLMSGREVPIFIEQLWAIPAGFLGAFLTLFLSRQFLVHVVFNKWMRTRFRQQIVIIGSNEEAQRISNHVIDKNAPFWVAGIIDAPGVRQLESTVPKHWIGELSQLPSLVEQFKIDEIVVTDEQIEKADLIALLDYATSSGITVWFPPKLLPIIEMKFYIDHFCGLPMVRLCSQKKQWLFMKIKHAVDALLALPLSFLLLPVFGVIALAIKMNSKGPVFYRAQAVGKNGKPFTIYKFRSMEVDTSHDLHRDYVSRLIKGEIKNGENKDQPLKITDDPRVTSVGKFLRKWSLDELPQIINVIKGEMSLVGPRPCLPYEYELYKDWHKKRTSVRPGITGLWQVAGRSAVAFEDMILLDLYYVYNRSLFMDMNTMYETLFAVLKKRGAY